MIRIPFSTHLWLVSLLLCTTASWTHAASIPAQPDPILRMHWMGTQQVAADTNAAQLVQLAHLPESVRLRTQTLEKLSRAPWALRGLNQEGSASELLQPILTDIFAQESQLLVFGAGDPSPSWLLACRLDNDRSSLWKTNLAVVVESLQGRAPTPLADNRFGWQEAPESNRASDAPDASPEPPTHRLYLTRDGAWTLVGAASNWEAFEALWKRMKASSSGGPKGQHWLEAEADLGPLCDLLSLPTDLIKTYPRMTLTVSGEGNHTSTEATFQFATPPKMELGEWNVPRNLIGQPLASFSALRGIDSLLSESAAWAKLNLGQPPHQLFVWSYGRQPMFTYFAIKTPSPTDFVSRAAKWLLRDGQSWGDSEQMVGFKWSTDRTVVEWQGLPYLSPFVGSSTTNGNQHVIGGSFPLGPVEAPIPASFYEKALSPTNLVYYDWEQTGPRLAHWLFMGQFIRFTSGHAQLPFESPGLLWLKALETRIDDSVTRVHRVQPGQLELTRTSSLGLTAIELHPLVDWLESPEFPRGLHTLVAPAP